MYGWWDGRVAEARGRMLFLNKGCSRWWRCVLCCACMFIMSGLFMSVMFEEVMREVNRDEGCEENCDSGI